MFKNIKESILMLYDISRFGAIAPIVQAVLNLFTQFIPVFLSAFVVNKLTEGSSMGEILPWAGLWLGIIGVITIVKPFIGQRWSMHTNTSYMTFRSMISKKAMTMDYMQVDSPKVNSIRGKMEEADQQGYGIMGLFNQYSSMINLIFGAVASVVIIFPLFLTDGVNPLMTLLFIAAVILITVGSSLFYAFVTNKQFFKITEDFEKKSVMSYFIHGKGMDYRAGKDIRIFNAQRLIQKHIDENEKEHRRYMCRLTVSESTGAVVTGISIGAVRAAAYLFVAVQAINSGVSAGDIIKYASTICIFSDAVFQLLNSASFLIKTAEKQKSRAEFLEVPDVMRKGVIPTEKRNDNKYELAFKNVSFKYPGSDEYALKNVSISFRVGEKMALVGMNGSGKTTLIKLLCRLYDPDEGVITLNDIDIRRYKYHEYMDIFSVVFQDFKLFSFSLAENVSTSEDFDRAKIEECLEKAGFGERLGCLDKGIDTCIYKDYDNDGIEISGGEAQKIAIARAIYKNAPFIILDEPTAALDPMAEYEIYSKFDEIAGDKTTIYISHRLSSCRFCDNITVFHQGEIVQRGSHDRLLKESGGLYKKLWNAQAQYYNSKNYNLPNN